jgi:hypothetical protein
MEKVVEMRKLDPVVETLILNSGMEVCIPRSHVQALKLDAHIVVGGLGVGKSQLTDSLKSGELCGQFARIFPQLQDMEVCIGFSSVRDTNCYPNADLFKKFCNNQQDRDDVYDLWRAVILRWVAQKAGDTIPSETWESTMEWMRSKPEDAARLMERPRGWKGLILFDELDCISDYWAQMDEIVLGLLRAILWLKGFSGLYGKVFLSTDQAERRRIFNFPDSSKLFATKVELIPYKKFKLKGC